MFDKKNISKYLLLLGIVLISSFIGKKFTNYYKNEETQDEYKLIKKYLLNESPLYGYNKPKLWIHTKYELNARNWRQGFQSRSSTDLNQPYIHLTIKSIVLHCGNDFNICLIDDDTFSKLIPSWNVNMQEIPEPKKKLYRELGLAQLLYIYGGMVVPNTFVCRKNLKDFYLDGTSEKTPFICEYINKTANSTAGTSSHFSSGDATPNYIINLLENANANLEKQKNNITLKQNRQRLLYLPFPAFMGSNKNDECMLEIVEYLKKRAIHPHFSSEHEILGDYPQWCLTAILEGKMKSIDGEMIGIKTMNDKKPILLENLLEEEYLDINPNAVGIYIPEEEILLRNKYQWFAVMSGEEILQSKMIISKYMVESIVNFAEPTYSSLQKTHTVLTI